MTTTVHPKIEALFKEIFFNGQSNLYMPDYQNFKNPHAQEEANVLRSFLRAVKTVPTYSLSYESALKIVKVIEEWETQNKLNPEIKGFVSFDDTIHFNDGETVYVIFTPNQHIPSVSKFFLLNYLENFKNDYQKRYDEYCENIYLMEQMSGAPQNRMYIEAKESVDTMKNSKEMMDRFKLLLAYDSVYKRVTCRA